MHYRTPAPPTGESTPDPDPPLQPPRPTTRLDLSASKIIGGALAAMTAAALGSTLGVAGTIIGAALASTVAAIAGALYTTSFTRTQERVRTAINSRPAMAAKTPIRVRKFRMSWRNAAIATVATFGLAAVCLTGVELLTGQPLSGGEGTTISQAAQQQRAREGSRPNEPDKIKSFAPAAGSPSAPASETPANGVEQPKPGPTTPATEPSAFPTEPSASPTVTEPPVQPGTNNSEPSATSVPSGDATQNAPTGSAGAESIRP